MRNKYPYIFKGANFRIDLEDYLEKSSVRKLSDELGGVISASKIQRFKKGDYAPDCYELCLICNTIGLNPMEYFERQLL